MKTGVWEETGELKMERLAYALFALAVTALFKASLITRPLYCRNIRHAAQSYLFSPEEPDPPSSWFLEPQEGKGVAVNTAIVFSQYLTVEQIMSFFTTTVAEYIRIASMQAFLLESQTHAVSTLHCLMTPVGGILASCH